MAENWEALAAEASADIAEDGFTSCLEKPPLTRPTSPHDTTTEGAVRQSDVTGIEKHRRIRDRSGTLIGKTIRTLTISTAGLAPKKKDRIAVGVATTDVTDDTVWNIVAEVRPLSPGGVVLLYEVDLEA